MSFDKIEPFIIDASCNLQKEINQIPDIISENNPNKYRPMMPTMLCIRDDNQLMKNIILQIRKDELRELIIGEYKEDMKVLLKGGMGFIPTHP